MKESNDLEILPLSSAVYISFLVNSFSNCGRILYRPSLVSEILDVEVTTLIEYDLQMSLKVISHQKWHQSKPISSL